MANPPLASDKAHTLNGRRNGSAGDVNVPRVSSQDAISDALVEQAARFNLRKYRPLGVADMFDEAFDLYKNNFRLLFFSTAIVYVPLYVVLIVFFNPLTKELAQMASSFDNFDSLLDLVSKTIFDTTVASLVYTFATILAFGAVGYIASQRYLGRSVTVLDAYSLSARRLLVLCIGAFLASLFTSFWVLGCGIAVLIPLCRFSILPQVAVLEKQGIYQTVVRCWKMTSSAYWRLAMVLTMLFVMNLVINNAFIIPLQWLQEYIGEQAFPLLSDSAASYNYIVSTVISCLVGLAIAPLGIAVMTVAYYDIRIRDEGYDMAILNELLEHGNADERAWVPDYKTRPIKKLGRKR